MFIEHTRQALARGRREGSTQAVLFLDLDDFKEVNDSLGHAVGDEVLVAVARRLDGAVRSVDTAARFGGDEFAILLEEVDSQSAADAAQRVLDLLAEPLRAGGREIAAAHERGRRGRGRRRPAHGGGADPRRRRRDVHRQARRQGRLPPVRADDARRRARPPRAALGPASARSTPASSSCTTSPSSGSATARSPASRRCCAGTTRSAGWSRRSSSSRSPRRPG